MMLEELRQTLKEIDDQIARVKKMYTINNPDYGERELNEMYRSTREYQAMLIAKSRIIVEISRWERLSL